jgi:hypothetical protein
MKIFIICCLLFIHVNMCIFIRRFRVSIRVSGIRSGFGYPRVWFWWWISTRIGFRFGFEFQFWVHGDSTQSEPDLLPSLIKHKRSWYKKKCSELYVLQSNIKIWTTICTSVWTSVYICTNVPWKDKLYVSPFCVFLTFSMASSNDFCTVRSAPIYFTASGIVCNNR